MRSSPECSVHCVDRPRTKGVRNSNHGRMCDRIDGWVGPEPTARLRASLWSEAAMQEKTKLCGPLRCPRSSTTLRRMERKEIKSEQLRNEASLNCASLRSRVHYVARRGLSRVEMNALRAPLTALSAPAGKCCHFLLDTADAFKASPCLSCRYVVADGWF
jgi:hypothetical protein